MPERTALPAVPTAGSLDRLDPTNLALAGFLARYRGATLRAYHGHLKLYVGWCTGVDLAPLAATRPHLELYLRWMEQQGWAEATVSLRFGTVATFYKYAELDGLIPRDPCVHVTRPKVNRAAQRRTFLTPLEYASLLEASRLAGPREHALVALLGVRGLRIAEACSLDVESMSVVNGHECITFVGKGGDIATLPLPIPAIRAVRAVISDRESGPLLLNRVGVRMNRVAATRILRRLAARAHIATRISPHSLRRTFCTSGLASGVPIYEMQLAMRHKDPATTALYDMAAGNMDRDAAHRVASYLSGMAS